MDSRAQIRDPADDWRGVTDSVERKRLQNRLAQRARRAKAKGSMPRTSTASIRNNTGSGIAAQLETFQSMGLVIAKSDPAAQSSGAAKENLDIFDPDSGSWLQGLGPLSPPSKIMEPSSPLVLQPILQSAPSLILNAMPAIAAFWANANVLQLECNRVLMLSQYPSPSTPRALAATPLQMTIPHKPYIDTLPFPALRDRILSALCVMDEDEFCEDLVKEQIQCWGHSPWDGKGWELPARFVDKWWFLMDEDLIDSTNFWRRERGEPELVWRGRKLGCPPSTLQILIE